MLADAQHVVARRHGFRSWSELLAAARDRGWQLRVAARLGDDDALYALLDDGVDANSTDPSSGWTALHEAVAADQLATVAALVGWIPADKQRRDRRGRTPLELADPNSPVSLVLTRFASSAAVAVLESAQADLAANVEVDFFAHLSAAPGVDRWPVGDGFAFRSGLPDNTRNVVVASNAAGDEVAATIARLAGVPALWCTRPGEFAPDLATTLERAGARPERKAVHMHANLATLAPLIDDQVAEADDPERLAGIDVAEARLLAIAGHPIRAFTLGTSATAVTFTAGATVLGVHLHVDRTQRRRGFARTLLRHVAAVHNRQGCVDAIISPTLATIPFYERLGFTLERSRTDSCYYLPP